MTNWTTLKAAIANVIKTNGNQEIAGQLLQNALNNIINAIGENATFVGKAIPTTNPGAPDGPVFYFANEPGVYSNFDGVELENPGLVVLYNSNSTWKSLKVYECLQDLGNSEAFPMSQKAITENLAQQIFSSIQLVTNGTIISKILRDCTNNNSYINKYGEIAIYSDSKTSGFIPVAENSDYEYHGRCEALAALCFYTKNKTLIQGVNPETNGPYYFTTPEGCKFIRYCNLGSPTEGSCYIRYVGEAPYIDASYKEEFIDPIDKVANEAITLRSIIYNNIYAVEVTPIAGKYVDRVGTVIDYANACMSSVISVKKGELIIVNSNGATTGGTTANMATISKTSADGTNIKPVTIKQTEGTAEDRDLPYSMYYANEDGYIILSWRGGEEDCKCYKSSCDILDQVYKKIADVSSEKLNLGEFQNKYWRTICTTILDVNKNIISGIALTTPIGCYLRKNGAIGTHWEGGGITPYFYIKGIKTLHYSGYVAVHPIDVGIIVFYDKNQNFISSIYNIDQEHSTGEEGEVVGAVRELDIDVPENAVWARCTSDQMVNFNIYALAPSVSIDFLLDDIHNSTQCSQMGFDKTKAIPQYLSNIMSLSNGIITSQEIEADATGKYIDINGNTPALASGKISAPLFVSKGEVIVFVGEGGSSGSTPLLASISKTDEDGSRYSPIVIRGEYGLHDNLYSMYYANEDGYVAFSWIGSTYHTVYRAKSDILDQVYKKIADASSGKAEVSNLSIRNDFYVWFNSCICIGDSVTDGHVYDYPRTPANGSVLREWSYPTQLAKMTKWTIENAAKAGISVTGWWSTYYPNYTYTDYQIAIMELGYNGGLTDSLDTDVEPYDNYQDYANTNTGCYCKIIEAIKEANPNILMVLLIPSRWTPTTIGSIVIRKIAEKYKLPYIDLSDKTYINLSDAKYHGLTNSDEGSINMVHFNSIGYLAKAQFIFCELNRLIEENAKEVNDIHGNYTP